MRRRLGLLMSLGLLGVSLAAVSLPADARKPQLPDPRLAEVQTVDLKSFHEPFPTDDQLVQPELFEYIRTQLGKSDVMSYQSPGDARLSVDCLGSWCRKVEAKLIRHTDGAVLWRSVHRRVRGIESVKDPRQIAREIVTQLNNEVKVSRGH